MQQVCAEYHVPFSLALGVAEIESNFRLDADNGISYGLMQINRSNFEWLRAEGIDPSTYHGNIEAGVKILAEHLETYEDYNAALMAYNCGATGARKLWQQGYTSSKYSRAVIAAAEMWQSEIDELIN